MSYTRLLTFKALALVTLLSSCASRMIEPMVGAESSVSSPAFSSTMARISNTPWTRGNQVITLENGDAYYPAMLEAIQNAQTSITFEAFAFVDGPMTRTFTEALAQKAQEGVSVLMIVDEIGSRHIGEDNEALLRSSGVRFHAYHPLNPLRPFRSNNRTHRKILVVDGRRAFTGGAGFAYAWEGNAQSADHWRDTQYEVNGPAVTQLQRAFAENWEDLTGETLAGSAYYPTQLPKGHHMAQFVFDSPQNRSNPLAHSVLCGINSARESLILEQAYFVPNKALKRALIAASRRGVEVAMLMPSDKTDSLFCRYASQNSWKELLKAGVRLYQYNPTMMHGKLLIADSRLSIVGSGNLDGRSFFINDEVNLHVLSPTFAAEQKAMFLRDLKQADEITPSNLSVIVGPALHRIIAKVISPQL